MRYHCKADAISMESQRESGVRSMTLRRFLVGFDGNYLEIDFMSFQPSLEEVSFAPFKIHLVHEVVVVLLSG